MDTKVKVLINCRKNALLQEFFVHNDNQFEIMSTSNFYEDIVVHLNVYNPDVYVIVADAFDMDIIAQAGTLKRSSTFADIAIVVVAPAEECGEFETKGSNLFAEVIKRSASVIIKEKIIAISQKVHIRKIKEEEIRRREEEERLRREEEERSQRELAVEAHRESQQSKKHVLVVDDDRNVLKLLKTALEEKYNVTSMLNGKMAEKYLETKTTDLILLDYQMPGDTGPDVFKKIRAMEKMSDTPIVFLTGVADRDKIQQVMELKPQGYLLKPIDMEKLFAVIGELI